MGEHCETCICGKRAPVQSEGNGWPAGSISWAEHIQAWASYAARFGREQGAERIAERGGFGHGELEDLLGHEPKTWEPR